jgi:hypothetical protein
MLVGVRKEIDDDCNDFKDQLTHKNPMDVPGLLIMRLKF